MLSFQFSTPLVPGGIFNREHLSVRCVACMEVDNKKHVMQDNSLTLSFKKCRGTSAWATALSFRTFFGNDLLISMLCRQTCIFASFLCKRIGRCSLIGRLLSVFCTSSACPFVLHSCDCLDCCIQLCDTLRRVRGHLQRHLLNASLSEGTASCPSVSFWSQMCESTLLEDDTQRGPSGSFGAFSANL